MPKCYFIHHCFEKYRQRVDEWAKKSRTMESRLIQRAKIIQQGLRGDLVTVIAPE